MNQVTALMGLITETSLHAGAGSSSDVIDLPIQREGHNGWPCVFGSAVKGAMRDHSQRNWQQDPSQLTTVFGPGRAEDPSAHAGALAVGDARLLLLPVRSLTSAFRWVTCPEALLRFQRDAIRMCVGEPLQFHVPDIQGMSALSAHNEEALFVEEYRLDPKPDSQAISDLADALALIIHRQDIAKELKKRLLVVSNDLFTVLTRNATQVNAHIALNSDTKTTSDGALWYEESLPPETVLYVSLMSHKSRNGKRQDSAAEIMKQISTLFSEDSPWLQLGGNETVGMGWCAVRIKEGTQHA